MAEAQGFPDWELGGQNRLDQASGSEGRVCPGAQGTLADTVSGACGLPWGCSLILPADSEATATDGNLPDVKPSCAN